MRIAMILPSLAAAGPGFVVKDLCTEFVAMGYVCKVFYFDDVKELEMPCPTKRIKFFDQIDFEDWDIIHSHMFRPDAYVWWHRRKIRKAGVKTVSTLHNPIGYEANRKSFNIIKSSILYIGWRFFLRSVDRVVILNSDSQSELPVFLKKKSQVIFNGRVINQESFEKEVLEKNDIKELKKRYKIIGAIGSLTNRKGCDQMVKVLSSLDDYALIIVGEGPEKEALIRLAKANGVEHRCLLIGFKEDPLAYLKYFDIFLMCSSSEGFPLALIEAASSGCPCVLSDISIFRSIITESNGAEFYKWGDITSLAHAIKIMETKRAQEAKQIRSYFESYLTSKKMGENYNRLYKILLTEK